LNESSDLHTHRGQMVKTFKPGGPDIEISGRNLPTAPGFGKVELWKKNKPSKRRVKVDPNNIKKVEDYNMYSDVGGDGGDQYLFDYEELKKAINEATGSTDQKNIKEIIEKYS
jgi:hypothetical protein